MAQAWGRVTIRAGGQMKSYLEMGGETEHGTGKCRNESQGGGSGRGKLTCA